MSELGAEFKKVSDEDREGIRHQYYKLFLDCDDILRLEYDSSLFDLGLEQHGEESTIIFYRKHTI